MLPSPSPTAISWDLRIRKIFEAVRARTIIKQAPPSGSFEDLLWRVGVSGSLLLVLTFLSFPLHPRLSLCGFLWLTGRPCPFCGITRAMAFLMKGEIALALSLHPLSPLALMALLVMFFGGPSRI